MGGYSDACISEFLFSKVLDSVYASHKHSVFFFFYAASLKYLKIHQLVGELLTHDSWDLFPLGSFCLSCHSWLDPVA